MPTPAPTPAPTFKFPVRLETSAGASTDASTNVGAYDGTNASAYTSIDATTDASMGADVYANADASHKPPPGGPTPWGAGDCSLPPSSPPPSSSLGFPPSPSPSPPSSSRGAVPCLPRACGPPRGWRPRQRPLFSTSGILPEDCPRHREGKFGTSVTPSWRSSLFSLSLRALPPPACDLFMMRRAVFFVIRLFGTRRRFR